MTQQGVSTCSHPQMQSVLLQEAQAFVDELKEAPELNDSAKYAAEEEATLPFDDGVLEEVCGFRSP